MALNTFYAILTLLSEPYFLDEADITCVLVA